MGSATISNLCGRALGKEGVSCVGCITNTGHPNCAGVVLCKPYVQTVGRKKSGLKVVGKRILFIRPDQIWVHRGWPLNPPSGNESSLVGFHEERSIPVSMCCSDNTAHALLFKIPFRVVQVPLVMQGLQARMGLPDPRVALVLLAVQDLLEQEVSPAHQVKKGHQAHEEKG